MIDEVFFFQKLTWKVLIIIILNWNNDLDIKE